MVIQNANTEEGHSSSSSSLRKHAVNRELIPTFLWCVDYLLFNFAYNTVIVVVKWLTILLRIREVPDSNTGPQTGYPDWRFRGFPQHLQANAGIVP
jgi:hypothetical protein